MSSKEHFEHLLKLYQSNSISIDGHDELFEMIASGKFDDSLDAAVLNELNIDSQETDADLPPHIAQEIVRNIYESEKNTIKVLPKKSKFRTLYTWTVAASIIAIMLVGYLFYFTNSGSKTSVSRHFKALIPQNTITVYNKSKSEKMVVLSDGSKVNLSPKSSIHYSRIFAGDSRDVYLEGDAFFQVTKNPMKPFLVYYDNIVTRVLGTSFRINTNSKTGKIEVAVRTGKVQVYENERMLSLTEKLNKATTIVTPNQKAIYDESSHLFENSIVEKPLKLLVNDTAVVSQDILTFEQETLSKIFQRIQSYYGIEIIVENTNLYNCIFSGDVSNLDLFSVLQSICIATNSSFEINGTKILIKGRGCY